MSSGCLLLKNSVSSVHFAASFFVLSLENKGSAFSIAPHFLQSFTPV